MIVTREAAPKIKEKIVSMVANLTHNVSRNTLSKTFLLKVPLNFLNSFFIVRNHLLKDTSETNSTVLTHQYNDYPIESLIKRQMHS